MEYGIYLALAVVAIIAAMFFSNFINWLNDKFND